VVGRGDQGRRASGRRREGGPAYVRADGTGPLLLEPPTDREAVPDYALDCHTYEGKRAGKTKRDFFRDEYGALKPRQPGLFDDDVENLK
jgi:hypothetical protein